MVDLIELYVHWHAGRSKSALAESLGIDRGTIRKYLAPAEAEGLVPGGEPLSEAQWRAKVAGWFPNPVVAESLLDRLINNSHQLFMNGPSYRPNKRPGATAAAMENKNL